MNVGRYEVLDEIGRGAAGRVVRARSPEGTLVAIKLLHMTKHKDALHRFARECRLLATLGEKEGFVPLIDAAESPEGPYIVMPLITGGTLHERLSRGALGIDESAKLVGTLAKAAGRAHAKGIVHR